MAADILLYDAEVVPVGKDQEQHLEITRNVAERIHNQVGELFVLPKAQIHKETMYVPGTDGAKMSKSKGNTINLFLADKKLRKTIMGIETDSIPLEEPKNPDTCNVFALYKLVASEAQLTEMRANYLGGNFGYGHAKQALYEVLIDKFSEERKRYTYYMNNLEEVDKALAIGAKKASEVANKVLDRVREKVGY